MEDFNFYDLDTSFLLASRHDRDDLMSRNDSGTADEAQVPSVMLTLPTPEMPASPVFSSGSPPGFLAPIAHENRHSMHSWNSEPSTGEQMVSRQQKRLSNNSGSSFVEHLDDDTHDIPVLSERGLEIGFEDTSVEMSADSSDDSEHGVVTTGLRISATDALLVEFDCSLRDAINLDLHYQAAQHALNLLPKRKMLWTRLKRLFTFPLRRLRPTGTV